MAEFCRKCSRELGMRGYDLPPLFYENFRKYKDIVSKRIVSFIENQMYGT